MTRRLRILMVLLVAMLFVVALLWNTNIGVSLRTSRPVRNAQEADSSEGVIVVKTDTPRESAVDTSDRTGQRGVSGLVLDQASMKPVPGARVYRSVPGVAFVESSLAATTDEGGRFELPTPARGTIQVVARGFRSATRIVTPVDHQVTVRLARGLTISGRVSSTDGSAISGVRVWAHRRENVVAWPNVEDRFPAHLPEGNVTRTGDRGEFEVSGLVPGEYVIRARHDGYSQRDWHAPPVIEAGKLGATITMVPVIGLEVVAKDAITGVRILGAQIGFQAAKNLSITGDLARGEAAPRQAPTGTGNDGVTRVYFAKVGTGETSVRLLCMAPGYLQYSEAVALQSRMTRKEILLDPVRAGRPGKLELAARFAGSGESFTGWLTLWLRSGGGTGKRVVEFVHGKPAEALVLPPGPYRYRVGGAGDVGFWWSDAAKPGKLKIIEDGRTPLRLELRGTLVDLEVVDRAGKPLRGYDLVINPKGGGTSGLVARWDTPANHIECFRWRKGYRGPDVILPPGTVKVGAWMAGVGRALAVVNLGGNGERITIRLPLKPEG